MKTNTFSISTTFLLTAFVTLSACAEEGHDENIDPPAGATERSLDDEVLPTEVYYTASRDFRKCAAPMCGGFYLHAVNVNRMTCADGTTVRSKNGCYVSEIDLQGMQLEDGALLHGDFVKKEYGGFGTWDTLVADAVYNPIFDQEHESYFRYNLVRDTGIRCITTPCPSQEIAKLNTPYSWNDAFTFNEVDDYGGSQIKAEDEFYAQYAEAGVIVDSHWHTPWYTGGEWELSITNVFVRQTPDRDMCLTVRDAYDDTIIAWNVDSKAQADALIGDPSQWQWTDLYEGTCATQAAVTSCLAQYAPLCGTIDVVGVEQTYSNECVLTQAVRTAAGDDAKAKVTPTKGECKDELECHLGDDDYDYVGNSPEQCQTIKFSCDPGEAYFADDCGCGCFTTPTPAPGEPGSLCGGFANAQCVAGLECDGLGDNGSTVGTCTCPAFINCFPGPNSPGCASNIQDLCPNSAIAY